MNCSTALSKTGSQLRTHAFNICLFACLALHGPSSEVKGNECLAESIQTQSQQIRCLADSIKDDLKCSLKGEKGYGRVVAVNARIRMKSAAICRRIERNCDYRGLCRDVAKINEFACELQTHFNESLAFATQCHQCPPTACQLKLAREIESLIAYTRGLDAILTGDAFVALPRVSDTIFPADPNFQFAPPVEPAQSSQIPVLQGPTKVLRPESTPQSVLNR